MPRDMSIVEFIVKEHEKIASLLEKLESEMREKDGDVEVAFNKFKWELERHFIVEEKAIFVEIGATDDSYLLTEIIVKEHRVLWDMVKDTENRIGIETVDISEFKEKLLKHKMMEEKTLYPILDQTFSEEQKKAILDRIENPL